MTADAVRKELYEWAKALAIAIVLSSLVRFFLLQPYMVDGSSMEPTMHDRERVFINRLVYRFSPPQHGDVVVVSLPAEDISIIKRVIAVPGDLLEIKQGLVWVNGNPLEETYLETTTLGSFGPVRVIEDGYFVLGDNRQHSRDSRDATVGFVSLDQIQGKGMFVYWPLPMRRIAR